MTRLGAARLVRLERAVRPVPGCPTCHGWTGVVLEGDDGPHRPAQCPGCGRLVPVTVTVQIEGVHVSLL